MKSSCGLCNSDWLAMQFVTGDWLVQFVRDYVAFVVPMYILCIYMYIYMYIYICIYIYIT